MKQWIEKVNIYLMLVLVAVGSTLFVTGCADDREDVGEQTQEAVDETSDGIEDAADEVEDEM